MTKTATERPAQRDVSARAAHQHLGLMKSPGRPDDVLPDDAVCWLRSGVRAGHWGAGRAPLPAVARWPRNARHRGGERVASRALESSGSEGHGRQSPMLEAPASGRTPRARRFLDEPMKILPQLAPPVGMTRVCAFSVATALAWIGHDCSGGCPTEAATVPASVWFVRTPAVTARSWATTLVVVDLSPRDGLGVPTQTPEVVRAMLRRVNDCTRPEHIRVRERVSGDHSHAVDATNTDPRVGAPLYLRAEHITSALPTAQSGRPTRTSTLRTVPRSSRAGPA